MRQRADQPLRDRKARDRAAVLPLVGALLFLPPVAGIFRLEATVGGIPLIVVCIFAVWAALIAGAAVLAIRLREAEAGEEPIGDTQAGDVAGDDAGRGPEADA